MPNAKKSAASVAACWADLLTGREQFIIAHALHVASHALLQEERPPYSDAEHMREILRQVFPNYAQILRETDERCRAIRWGYTMPMDSYDHAAVLRYLAEHEPKRRVHDEPGHA
jgi:hypothetical protein